MAVGHVVLSSVKIILFFVSPFTYFMQRRMIIVFCPLLEQIAQILVRFSQSVEIFFRLVNSWGFTHWDHVPKPLIGPIGPLDIYIFLASKISALCSSTFLNLSNSGGH